MWKMTGWFKPRVINERYKLYMFDIIRVFTLLVRPWYLWRFRAVTDAKVALGSGPYYAAHWINVEVNPAFKKDVWQDLRDALPFREDSVAIVYSAHVFEHLFINEFHWVLKECYRILKPGGILRICLPCLRKNIEAYVRKDESFFRWEPAELDPFKDPTLAAKFSRNVLVDGSHKNMFDYESLKHILSFIGFRDVTQADYRQSALLSAEDLQALEPEELAYRGWNSFVAEARK